MKHFNVGDKVRYSEYYPRLLVGFDYCNRVLLTRGSRFTEQDEIFTVAECCPIMSYGEVRIRSNDNLWRITLSSLLVHSG